MRNREAVPFKRDLQEATNMRYEIQPCVEGDEEIIEEKLTAIDYSIVPPEENVKDENLVFRITDDEGNIIAGCIVEITSWKFAFLDILWVEEKYRRKGLGSALVREAEKAARERGCYAMLLGTFDFQARPLYEKHGYILCCPLRDYPRGHMNYSLMKRLDRPVQEYSPSKDQSAGYEIRLGDEDDAEIINDRLCEFNSSQVSREHTYIPLNKKLLDGAGKMIAAIFAGVGSWNAFDIDMMWVDEAYRNQGIGSELLAETEREAKEHGAYKALVWGLFDWQTGFFSKNGYTEVGTLEDCPKGHCMHDMEKRF